jgi:hypothetical protein
MGEKNLEFLEFEKMRSSLWMGEKWENFLWM